MLSKMACDNLGAGTAAPLHPLLRLKAAGDDVAQRRQLRGLRRQRGHLDDLGEGGSSAALLELWRERCSLGGRHKAVDLLRAAVGEVLQHRGQVA